MSKKDPSDDLIRTDVPFDHDAEYAYQERLRKRLSRELRVEAEAKERQKADELLDVWAREAGASSAAEFLLKLFPDYPKNALRMGRVYMALRLEIMKHERLGRARLAAVTQQLSRDFAIEDLDARPPETSKQTTVETPSSEFKLPDNAPELWSKREGGRSENPAQFLRRVYGRWLNGGLKRKHLAHLDPPLYRALGVWLHRHPEDEIEELPLNTDDVDRQLAALAEQFSPDDLRKLGLALQSRLRRMKQ